MYKVVLQHGFFKTMARGYQTSPNEYLEFLLSRLSYLPGFMEARTKNYISQNDLMPYSTDLIETTLKQVFSTSRHLNSLNALENKKFTLPELLKVDDTVRSQYLQILNDSSTRKIPTLASIKDCHEEQNSYCLDHALARFTRP